MSSNSNITSPALLSGPQLPDRPLRLLVLGAGIVGVSTAVALQEFFSPTFALTPYASLPSTLAGDSVPLTEPLARTFDYAAHLRASMLRNAGESATRRIEELANKVKVEVTLVGERFAPDTTGDVAAGLWTPISVPEDKLEVVRCAYCSGHKPRLNYLKAVIRYFFADSRVLKWGKATWELLAALQKTELQQYLGIFYAPLWKLFDNPEQPVPLFKGFTKQR